MPNLNDMTPEELAAAMRGGTLGWGVHGSALDHVRYSQPTTVEPRRRRMCRCGCRRKVTHIGMANGVGLAWGCELYIARWVRNPVAVWRAGAASSK